MRRRAGSILIVAVLLLFLVIESGITDPTLMLVLVTATALAGIVPFIAGLVAQLLVKHSDLKAWVPWVIGAVFGTLRLALPQLGGLDVMESELLSVVFTVLLSAAFAELGSLVIRVVRSRHLADDRSSASHPGEA